MKDRLAVAALVNGIFIKVQANMAAWALQINMGELFTNRKLRSTHSQLVTRSRPKASTYSYAGKKHPKRRKCW